MDEEEINDEVEYPAAKRHDRWSLLVLGLNWAQRVTAVTADTLNEFTIAASQHANQARYDGRFKEIAQWERQ